MEFRNEKYATIIMKTGKKEKVEEIKLRNQESMRTLEEKENYKYKKMLKADTIKQAKMKGKKEKKIESQKNEKAS